MELLHIFGFYKSGNARVTLLLVIEPFVKVHLYERFKKG